MNIGNKIYELRTAMNLSQGDLADMLDVSRQSVSKWETNAAIPDLDKLCKLCDVFGVTLDELTCREGKEIGSPTIVTISKQEHPMVHQKVIGYILLSVSLIAGILIWILAESKEKLYIPVPIIISVLICGLICLFVKHRAGYWCIWALAASPTLLAPYALGFPAFVGIRIIIFAFIMALAAGKLFADTKVSVNKKKSIFIVCGWVILIGVYTVSHIIFLSSVIDSEIGLLPYIVTNLLVYIGTALLLTYTVCYIKNLKHCES